MTRNSIESFPLIYGVDVESIPVEGDVLLTLTVVFVILASDASKSSGM